MAPTPTIPSTGTPSQQAREDLTARLKAAHPNVFAHSFQEEPVQSHKQYYCQETQRWYNAGNEIRLRYDDVVYYYFYETNGYATSPMYCGRL